MTASKTRRNLDQAQRVRDEYRLQKARRIAEINEDLVDPVIDATWLADPADGTLKGNLVREQNLPVSVSAWTSLPHPDCKIRYVCNGRLVQRQLKAIIRRLLPSLWKDRSIPLVFRCTWRCPTPVCNRTAIIHCAMSWKRGTEAGRSQAGSM